MSGWKDYGFDDDLIFRNPWETLECLWKALGDNGRFCVDFGLFSANVAEAKLENGEFYIFGHKSEGSWYDQYDELNTTDPWKLFVKYFAWFAVKDAMYFYEHQKLDDLALFYSRILHPQSILENPDTWRTYRMDEFVDLCGIDLWSDVIDIGVTTYKKNRWPIMSLAPFWDERFLKNIRRVLDLCCVFMRTDAKTNFWFKKNSTWLWQSEYSDYESFSYGYWMNNLSADTEPFNCKGRKCLVAIKPEKHDGWDFFCPSPLELDKWTIVYIDNDFTSGYAFEWPISDIVPQLPSDAEEGTFVGCNFSYRIIEDFSKHMIFLHADEPEGQQQQQE